MRGAYGSAIKDFGNAIQLNDNIPGLYMARGMAYLDRGIRDNRWDTMGRAEEDFDRAVLADVNNGRAYALRGFVRALRNNPRGIADIRQAQSIDASLPPEGFAGLGMYAMDAQVWDQSRSFFNKGLELVAPGFPVRSFIKRKIKEIDILERKRIRTSTTRRQIEIDTTAEQELRALSAQLRDGDPVDREAAAKALGFRGNDGAVAPLIDALQDPDVRVRSQAADSIGKIGSAKSSKVLLPYLTAKDRRFRGVVVRALGDIGSERAKKPLTARLTKEKEKVIRNEIRASLKKIEDAAYNLKLDVEYMLEEFEVELE